MKRSLLMLLSLVTLMGSVAGCGKQSDSLPAAPNTESYGMTKAESDYDTAAEIVHDACARVCFEKGLTHWGSYCESAPVTSEAVFTRNEAKEPGDSELSAFTAASFLAWLDDAYGFEQVSLFCFGQKSFEEAFGTDYQSAFDAWHAWIEQTYSAE